MKTVVSLVAILLLGVLLWMRLTGRIGDRRSFQERSVSTLYHSIEDRRDDTNGLLEHAGVSARLYRVTRTSDRITLTYTVGDNARTGGIAAMADERYLGIVRDNFTKYTEAEGITVADVRTHRDELAQAAVVVRFEDLRGKTLESGEISLLSLMENAVH